jgi:hypothetical protein
VANTLAYYSIATFTDWSNFCRQSWSLPERSPSHDPTLIVTILD